jgi:Phage integrase SAM-like domain
MPSIHRQPGRPYWFCAFSIWNPETLTSRRVFRSTKTRDKKQALEICRAWHKAALKARNGKLSVDAAREVIAQGVSDVFTAANVESLPSASVNSWCERWTEAKAIETEESTHARYKRVIERFIGFFGESKSKRDLSTLQASDVARFRDREAKELSRSTANLGVKVLRICLGEAVRQGLLALNPAVRVKLLKSKAESKRRAFTLTEIKRILRACGDDTEWRGHRVVRPVSRPTARRLSSPHVACSRFGLRRDCVYDAQDWTAHRAAPRETARRLFGIIASERQPERFHFPSRSEREAHGVVVESVPGNSR